MAGQAKYWTVVCYPENMVEDWELKIGDIIQYPLAYCVHDLSVDSKSEHRKDHVHIMAAWGNNTTYNAALRVFQKLSAPGKVCCNKVEQVFSVRNCYDYLIHDTDACKLQGKEQYDPSRRICLNGFDIGLYEQISLAEKDAACTVLRNEIIANGIFNFVDLEAWINEAHVEELPLYTSVTRSFYGYLGRLCDANYQKKKAELEKMACTSRSN